jgi:pimeloyl-ACP methyl ester carboxylesterase
MLMPKGLRTGLTRRGLLVAAGLAFAGPGRSSRSAAAPRLTARGLPEAQPWMNLPDTPDLPAARRQGHVELNGAPIFFSQFGDGPHVLMLHGGLANSNYWGHQIRALAPDFLVTVMDTRGHGRSAVTSDQFSYALFARDAVALMKHLGITKTIVVGWSDGAITGIQLALVRPDLVAGLFAFGANTTLQGLIGGGARTRVFRQFSERCSREYRALSPHPEKWPTLTSGLSAMWRSQPTFTKAQLASIKIPVAVADGEHDEIIRAEHTRKIAADIPGAELVIMEKVSHFALLQDPPGFNAHLLQFVLGIADDR